MKKKILAIALAVVLIAVAGYSTLAYFTATDTATNKITADTLTIIINEYQTDGDDEGTELDLISSGPNGIGITVVDAVPGDIVSKIPKVKNLINNTDAWIRVKVTLTCMAADTTTVLSTDPITLDMGADWALKAGDATDIWYYNAALPADTETSALFTEVTFDLATMNNAYQGAVVTIVLEAQAVQSANNPTSALTASGWPAF